jgi:hypothetical protein
VSLGKHGTWWRCLLVWLVADVALGLPCAVAVPVVRAGWWSAAGADRGAGLDRLPLDTALTALAATALVICAGWAWLAVTAEVLAAARGRSRIDRPGACRLPDGLRRVVLGACGIALAGGMTAPALAGTADPPSHHGRRAAQHGVVGLPLPQRASLPRRPGPHPDPAGAHVAGPRSVVVSPGDSLWRIAAADLPPGASPARVCAHWHALYAANRAVIGPDPDRIEPGQHLFLPGKDQS